jgi:hypothetical protein
VIILEASPLFWGFSCYLLDLHLSLHIVTKGGLAKMSEGKIKELIKEKFSVGHSMWIFEILDEATKEIYEVLNNTDADFRVYKIMKKWFGEQK